MYFARLFKKNYFRGLFYVSKDRTARVKALADSLLNSKYDVVCLQELWCEVDYKYLKQSCREIFKYIHYFHRYVMRNAKIVLIIYVVNILRIIEHFVESIQIP